jgi:hypothetical protein
VVDEGVVDEGVVDEGVVDEGVVDEDVVCKPRLYRAARGNARPGAMPAHQHQNNSLI